MKPDTQQLWETYQNLDLYKGDAILSRVFGYFESMLESEYSSGEEKRVAKEFFSIMELMMKEDEK